MTPQRGLRQGDPLSPFLFIICAEAFSLLFNKLENERLIHGEKISRGAPSITHLMFADDLLVFCRASPSEGQMVMDAITYYSQWSGQNVNLGKSCLFFSKNTQASVIANILYRHSKTANWG